MAALPPKKTKQHMCPCLTLILPLLLLSLHLTKAIDDDQGFSSKNQITDAENELPYPLLGIPHTSVLGDLSESICLFGHINPLASLLVYINPDPTSPI